MRATARALAQILGQSADEESQERGDKGEAHMHALTLLADFGMLWKTLHHHYHGMLPSVAVIVEFLTVYNHGQRAPVRPNEVAPAELRRLVFSENLTSAIVTLHKQTSKAISGIEEMLAPETPEWPALIQELRKHGSKKLAANLTEIADDRNVALVSHGEFLRFLEALKKFVGEPDWDMTHVKFFLDSRPLLDEKFHEVIRRADSAILQVLECFNEITNHYYRATK